MLYPKDLSFKEKGNLGPWDCIPGTASFLPSTPLECRHSLVGSTIPLELFFPGNYFLVETFDCYLPYSMYLGYELAA